MESPQKTETAPTWTTYGTPRYLTFGKNSWARITTRQGDFPDGTRRFVVLIERGYINRQDREIVTERLTLPHEAASVLGIVPFY